jgi:hypothetical protein
MLLRGLERYQLELILTLCSQIVCVRPGVAWRNYWTLLVSVKQLWRLKLLQNLLSWLAPLSPTQLQHQLVTPRSMVAKLHQAQIPPSRMAIELVHCVRLLDAVRPLLLSGLPQKVTVVLKWTVKSSHPHFAPAAAAAQLQI